MHSQYVDGSFADWRQQARQLLQAQIDPSQVLWLDSPVATDLFASTEPAPITAHDSQHQPFRIPREVFEKLEQAAQYRCEQRWALLYQILWAVVQGQQSALLMGSELGSQLQQRLKSVRREAHHLHAFLRFFPSPHPDWDLVAWFNPAHDILASASQHFIGRLGTRRWMIATPKDAVSFDGQHLHYQRHCPADWQQVAQAKVENQALWHTYYHSIFNPARSNPSALTRQMPTRFWKDLPEGPLIPRLLQDARNGGQRDGQASWVAQQPGKQIRARPDTD